MANLALKEDYPKVLKVEAEIFYCPKCGLTSLYSNYCLKCGSRSSLLPSTPKDDAH